LGNPEFSGGRGEGGPLFPGAGDISMPSTGCSMLLDGVLTLCDFVIRNFNSGAIQKELKKADGTTVRQTVEVSMGVARVWHPGGQGNSSMEIDYSGPIAVIRTNNNDSPYWEFLNDVAQDTLPSDLKARVQDIGDNCADFLNQFFDALGPKVHSHDLGALFDRLTKIEISSKAFKDYGLPPDAVGTVTFFGKNRNIFVKPAAWYNRPNYQQFRWNAIANTVVAELMHHARNNGIFSDSDLDNAALKVMEPTEKKAALATMNSKGYQSGVVGHGLVKQHCRSTNPYGPPPQRR
jgi:hypothetical protein